MIDALPLSHPYRPIDTHLKNVRFLSDTRICHKTHCLSEISPISIRLVRTLLDDILVTTNTFNKLLYNYFLVQNLELIKGLTEQSHIDERLRVCPQ